jgi:hypothetical protein
LGYPFLYTLTDDIAPVAPPKGVFKKIGTADFHPESPETHLANWIVPAFCARVPRDHAVGGVAVWRLHAHTVTPTSVARVQAQDNSLGCCGLR